MFCKFCGKMLEADVTECPACGQKQKQLMNGNGFWDLCASGPVSSVPVDLKMTETEETDTTETEELEMTETKGAETQRESSKRGGRGMVWGLIVLCIGLICLSTYLGIRLKQVSDEQEQILAQEAELREELQKMENDPFGETETVPTGTISVSANDEGRSPSGNDEMEILSEEQEH